MAATFSTVDDYIATFPDGVRPVLQEVRERIHAAVPGLGETIRYGMPAFNLDAGTLVYLGGWKQHISLYPITTVDPSLEAEIAPYRAAKGTLRFPLRKPIPYDLIQRLVRDLRAQWGP